jgi:hypothetical protein
METFKPKMKCLYKAVPLAYIKLYFDQELTINFQGETHDKETLQSTGD